VAAAPRLTAAAKGKQPARATSLTDPLEVERTEALVDAYEADKTILESYGDTAILKKRRRDDDDQEGPSAGSDRGSKRRREGGEPESA
nr:hypothetical protein [Tanacetum cinerariifolium]